MGTDVMARPKGASGKSKAGGGRLDVVLTLKGAPEWKAWVDRLAARDRSTTAGLIDRALTHYAKAIGFDEAPPAR